MKLTTSTRPETLRLVNCANCNRELLGESERWRSYRKDAAEFPPPIGGHVKGRPYCFGCMEVRRLPSLAENLTPRQSEKLH